MGIVDLKLTPEGEPVWLEVNPQGQFLFLDALANLNLAEKFAAYLVEEWNKATVAAMHPNQLIEACIEPSSRNRVATGGK